MKIKNIKQNFILNGIPHWKIGIDRFLNELKEYNEN